VYVAREHDVELLVVRIHRARVEGVGVKARRNGLGL
jgi:hypothetical protein